VVFESHSLEGFHDPERHMAEIRRIAGEYIAGMTPTVVVPAMLVFNVQGQWITRQVSFIGVDEKTHSQVSDFSHYLQHPANRKKLSFSLRDGGYDTQDHQAGADAPPRDRMEIAGWKYRRIQAKYLAELKQAQARPEPPEAEESRNPFQKAEAEQGEEFDPAREQWTGIVMGIALASFRARDGSDRFLVLPGDDVKVTLPTAGTPPKAVSDNFTIVDFYESKMSEYDSNFVFVPIEKIQQMRGMIDPATGIGNVTSIQIKLHDDANGKLVRDKLQAAFPGEIYGIQTWRDKQGPLLAAVQMETAILNLLLFMIIAVAGFGILAIFYMIVVEKTRDIGILKSLGAPSRGILGIFLAYGLSLGIVGSGVGMAIGLLFVRYINEIADGLGWLTGRPVFDPSIYYFYKIPAVVVPQTLAWIVIGALSIAVAASILPARRAARLHPVEALRYE
jgi:lipoprotein-releasing system permease protein